MFDSISIDSDVDMTNPEDVAMDIVLDPEMVEAISHWHGGQFTHTYRLCSTAMYNPVSVAMIELASIELHLVLCTVHDPFRAEELSTLIGDLECIAQFPAEYRHNFDS